MFFPYVYKCANPHACSVPRGQKRVLDFLELELKTFVSCHMGARN